MARIRTTITLTGDVLENTRRLAEIEDRSVSRILERSLKLYLSISANLPDVEYGQVMNDVMSQIEEEDGG